MFMKKSLCLVPTRYKASTVEIARELVTMLKQLDFAIFVEEGFAEVGVPSIVPFQKIDYFVLIGGDGSFVASARKYLAWQAPFIGVSAGHLNFLADTSISLALLDFKQLLENNVLVEEREVLECSMPNGEKFLAINDIVLHRGLNPGIIELTAFSNNEFICDYLCDGLILSTPTGSTAYSLSAGGPIVYPEARTITMASICPQSLAYRPIVLPSSIELEIQYITNQKPIQISIDGQINRELAPMERILVKAAGVKMKMVKLKNHSYWVKLSQKLGLKVKSRADQPG
ncbi:MAG: NAD(+)/NADH kinase [Chlamydiae bacterium]|nr:NAD(+)/NADH kinase [Chlamydiota bacterium]